MLVQVAADPGILDVDVQEREVTAPEVELRAAALDVQLLAGVVQRYAWHVVEDVAIGIVPRDRRRAVEECRCEGCRVAAG